MWANMSAVSGRHAKSWNTRTRGTSIADTSLCEVIGKLCNVGIELHSLDGINMVIESLALFPKILSKFATVEHLCYIGHPLYISLALGNGYAVQLQQLLRDIEMAPNQDDSCIPRYVNVDRNASGIDSGDMSRSRDHLVIFSERQL